MKCMVSSRPKQGTRPVFFNFQVLHQNSVLLAVNASLLWFNNASGVYLVQVSLLLIGHWGLGYFFRYRPLYLIVWKIVQSLRQRRRKRPIQRNTSKPIHFYQCTILPLLVICRNDKNKQLTLISQRKLAFTARNKLFAL
jgi:hypothetical protein